MRSPHPISLSVRETHVLPPTRYRAVRLDLTPEGSILRFQMNDSERLVSEALAAKGLRCEEFSKDEKRAGRTPDFRVFQGGALAFFCEVKEIAPDRVEGVRPDPIPNRLSADIHRAAGQFDAVNPQQEHPNVLAFVNNDDRCDSLDLVGVVTGHLLLEGNRAAPIYTWVSEGRIRDEKDRIHLYLWFDRFKANRMFFNFNDRRHFDRLCGYLGIDPAVVRDIRDDYRPA